MLPSYLSSCLWLIFGEQCLWIPVWWSCCIFKMPFYLLTSKETKVLKNLLSLKMSSMKSTGRINFTGFLTSKTIFSFRLSFFSLPARHLAFSLLSCWIFLLRRWQKTLISLTWKTFWLFFECIHDSTMFPESKSICKFSFRVPDNMLHSH